MPDPSIKVIPGRYEYQVFAIFCCLHMPHKIRKQGEGD